MQWHKVLWEVDMADLKFDTATIKDAAKKYRKTAEGMEKVREALKRDIEHLKSKYWKSNAGDEFQTLYEDSWARNVDKYVAVMKELASILDNAADDYEQLAEEANRLRVDSI